MVFVNGTATELPEPRTLLTILQEFGIDPASVRGVAVAVNEEVVRKSEWPGVTLSAGDRVEIVTAKQGG
ncbi:MAG TPA: sulfur carrier protein ThiS [Rhodothermales bacterium]